METIPTRPSEFEPASLFPEECRVRWSEPRSLEDLSYESEASLAEGWAPKVQGLYAAGRVAAHQALSSLGVVDEAIPREESGAPLWPEGTLGSITHTEGMALAVVGKRDKVRALGIDVEKIGRELSQGLVGKVSSKIEEDWIAEQESNLRLLQLLSAKEAIFKAVFSLTKIRLGFLDAEIKEKKGCFSVEIKHSRVSKEWPSLKFILNQGFWKGYLVSGLWIKN